MYQFEEPISPHLAASRSSQKTPSDGEVLSRISQHIRDVSKKDMRPSTAYIETAGGVHSPAPSGSSTASLLRPLRLPTILVGDSELGGISTTKSAYDSLIMAGHDVQALVLFSDSGRGLGNAEYLQKWGQEVDLPVWGLAGPSDEGRWGLPPTRRGTRQEDEARMRDFYRGLVLGREQEALQDESPNGILQLIKYLRQAHLDRFKDLDSMASRTLDSCWWPFTQHNLVKKQSDVNVIDSAHGDFFSIYRSDSYGPSSLENMLDGSASWWTQCLGHADASLTRAATRAAGRYGHVLFPMCSNEPSLRLSEMLLGRNKQVKSSLERSSILNTTSPSDESRDKVAATPAPGEGWASKVFFSDDGSTGMEVALKMAIASTAARYSPSTMTESTKERIRNGKQPGHQGGRPSREWKVLGLKGSYHGDTIGAMDACEGNIYNEKVQWYRSRGDWLEPPRVAIKDGKVTVELPLQDQDWSRVKSEQAVFQYDSLASVYNVENRVHGDELHKIYTNFIKEWIDRLTGEQGNQYGALILEPLVMGAGGMIFVDPLFQRCFVDVVRQNQNLFSRKDPPLKRESHIHSPTAIEGEDKPWQGIPVIFDEVFTGLYRLGWSTPALSLGVKPDISCLAKILTGGMVPMSVTLASQSIFETFTQSDQKVDALLHGHSYTAHPIGCEVARETLKKIEEMKQSGAWSKELADWDKQENSSNISPWSFWSKEAVLKLSSMEKVDKVMSLGTVLVVELKDMAGSRGYSSTASVDVLQKLRLAPDGPFAIHARPLGNVIYFMCSLNTPEDVRRKTEFALISAL